MLELKAAASADVSSTAVWLTGLGFIEMHVAIAVWLSSAPQLQRPGVEDVEVLQKELVQVQTLMDSMTREREEESERLKHHYEQLQANYATSEVRGRNT